MTASGPMFNCLLKLAAIAFLTTSAFSQARPNTIPPPKPRSREQWSN